MNRPPHTPCRAWFRVRRGDRNRLMSPPDFGEALARSLLSARPVNWRRAHRVDRAARLWALGNALPGCPQWLNGRARSSITP